MGAVAHEMKDFIRECAFKKKLSDYKISLIIKVYKPMIFP